MMKLRKYFVLVPLMVSSFAYSQKIGVVDTNYILDKLPQYKEAESRLNAQIANWQTEIQAMQTDYDKKKATFENEKVLLVGDQLKQRQKEVDDLDKSIKKLINTRFGTMGEINNSRSGLTKPFQDQIWNAIQTVSTKNSLGIVLDKSNNISVIYLEKRYDYTDKVLDLLLKNSGGSAKGSSSSSNSRGNSAQESGGSEDNRKIKASKLKVSKEARAQEINQ